MSSLLPSDGANHLQALRRYKILETSPEPCFDHITRLAQQFFRVPITFVSLVDHEHQWFKSSLGLGASQTPRDIDFCAHVILSGQVLVVPDATQDARFADKMQVAAGIRFYAGAPVLTHQGLCVGTVGIMDTVPHVLSAEEQGTLEELAATAATLLERRQDEREARQEGEEHSRRQGEEHSKHESELHYDALIQNLNEIIYFAQNRTAEEHSEEYLQVLMMSEQVEAVTGYRPEEFLGDSALLFSLLHPSDEAHVRRAHRAVEVTKKMQACEFRIRHRDSGEYRWLEGKIVPRLGESGRVTGLWGMARDISTRKKDEERLRLLESVVVTANDAILITEAEPFDSPGPRILYVNPAFTQTTGYSAQDVIGKTPRILQGPDTSREALDEIRTGLEQWQPIKVELQNYRKDGTQFWVEMSIVPIADANGWFTHWVSVQRETTERHQSEAALRVAKEESEEARTSAEAANKAKSEFLSRMSHELRTPMNAILGFAQLFDTPTLSEDDRDSVEQILKAGRHLLGLINEVLEMARIESGQVILALEPVNVYEIVREVLDLMQPLAAARGIRLQDAVSTSSVRGDTYLLADRQRIKQVLLNLLSNAVKYNVLDGRITIACHQVQVLGGSAYSPRVIIEVIDSGAGIAPGDLDKLFTPFERLGAGNSGIEGTGIGLSLSRRLAELMDGALTVRSVLGQGSTFCIEMPGAQGPDSVSQESSNVSDFGTALLAAEDPSAPRTVLYIEDNMSNLRLIERILARQQGIRLISAMQGRLGLELAREHHPDLLLLDLHLPDISGAEVLADVRADARLSTLPVVVLSADATPQQVAHLLNNGANAYLTKPLNVQDFLQVLEQHLPELPHASST